MNKNRTDINIGALWPLYLFVNYTVARTYEEYLQLFLWGGLVPVIIGMFYLIYRMNFIIPITLEFGLLFFIFIWAVVSAVIANNFDWKYLRFFFQFAIVSYLVCLSVTQTRSIKIYFWVFLLIGAYSSFDLIREYNWNVIALLAGKSRQVGVFTNENLLGIYSAFGILGGFALLGFKGNLIRTLFLVLCMIISIVGVTVSGSRGALLLTIFYIIWWSLVIMRKKINNWTIWFALIIVVFSSAYIGFNNMIEGTVLHQRIENTKIGVNSGGSEARWELFVAGFNLGFTNPLFGVSLGGFKKESGTGFDYAHNDVADVFASLGVIGLLIYLLAHWVIMKRLSSKDNSENKEERYIRHIGLMIILSIFLSAAIFRPNFTAMDIWISFGLVAGISRLSYSKNFFK